MRCLVWCVAKEKDAGWGRVGDETRGMSDEEAWTDGGRWSTGQGGRR